MPLLHRDIAYDVALAGRAADRYNDEHGLALAPAVIRTPTTTVAGVSVAARF